jgi:hypothetical protein
MACRVLNLMRRLEIFKYPIKSRSYKILVPKTGVKGRSEPPNCYNRLIATQTAISITHDLSTQIDTLLQQRPFRGDL